MKIALNPINVIMLDFRARTVKDIVASTRLVRLRCIVGIFEVEPD